MRRVEKYGMTTVQGEGGGEVREEEGEPRAGRGHSLARRSIKGCATEAA